MSPRAAVLVLACLATACPSPRPDPPPPPTKPEIVPAPPRARGALAAGTDAAPGVENEPNPFVLPQPKLAPGMPKAVPPTTPDAPDGGTAPPDGEQAPAEPPNPGTPL
jgi:hypothetical protein